MDLLVLDTATERGMFSYLRNGNELFTCYLPFGLQEAQGLLGKLQEYLNERNMSLQSLDAIAVGVGPGSYTGIRIAATIGKMLSYPLKVPLVGVSTLETFVPTITGEFATVIDAKIAGVYLQRGLHNGTEVKYEEPPQVLLIEEAIKLLKTVHTLVSPSTTSLQQKLLQAAPDHTWTWEESAPSPQQMYSVALMRLSAGEGTLTGDLELLYMRKTQAEIEAEKKAL